MKLSPVKIKYPVVMQSPSTPRTVAEQAQRALRILYHDAQEDASVTGFYSLALRVFDAKVALTKLFKKTEFHEKVILNKQIELLLKLLYNRAFRDRTNHVGAGWANATMTRRKIADALKSDGFQYTANELRKKVDDNLRGDY